MANGFFNTGINECLFTELDDVKGLLDNTEED